MKSATSRGAALLAALAGIVVLIATPANAQTCSANEVQTRAQYDEAALAALMSGDMYRYRNIKLELDQRLSSECRQLLDLIEPMRVRCSAQEKSAVLQHFHAVFEAAQYADILRVLNVMLNLENSVSQQCWIASNRHIDTRVVSACTGPELDHIASFTGPWLRMTRDLLTGGNVDLGFAFTLGDQITGPLSQQCNHALAVYQQENTPSPTNPGSYGPSSVIDHGGGTYSVPGTGACSSSGCIAY